MARNRQNFYFEVFWSRSLVLCKVTKVTKHYMNFILDLDIWSSTPLNKLVVVDDARAYMHVDRVNMTFFLNCKNVEKKIKCFEIKFDIKNIISYYLDYYQITESFAVINFESLAFLKNLWGFWGPCLMPDSSNVNLWKGWTSARRNKHLFRCAVTPKLSLHHILFFHICSKDIVLAFEQNEFKFIRDKRSQCLNYTRIYSYQSQAC